MAKKIISCQCCNFPKPNVTLDDYKRGENRPEEPDARIVTLRGHERHWVRKLTKHEIAQLEEAEVYTMDDFIEMSVADRFGFWMLCHMDEVKIPEPTDYSNVYTAFVNLSAQTICKYLTKQEMNKP